ncbi:MAG TPA: efflux RND transporter permease subunit, partial [Thermoanaerobaculia bacterium]|nr:efflux RND transporter permease subunit [Thermoanaerobaculia bacterium]
MTEQGPAGSFVTRRPVGVLMVFLAAVVFGAFSLARLPGTLMPELTYPTLTVRTEYPGAAPEEVETSFSRPIEEALGVIGGMRRISSVSRAGLSDVILELAWDADVSEATQDALERLDQVFLPDEAEQPLILHYDPSLDPVMELSLSADAAGERGPGGEEGLRRLRRIAELQVKRALEPVKGVAAVRVRGGLEEEIHVLLDGKKLRATGISPQAVIDRLRQENVNVAGGTLEEGRTEYMVRTLNEYQDLGQIGETIVSSMAGRDVRIRDLGRVVRAHKDREIVTETDGAESVQIDVYKEADANIVALADRVRTAIGEIRRAGLGPPESEAGTYGRAGPAGPSGLAQRLHDEEGVRLAVVADRSTFIEGSIDEVKSAALLGGALAILVLFAFLANVRSTVIVGLAIPISLAITFAPLHLLGVSLNIMSLGGLALGIGMLVDSSIVVLESVFRCREEGDDVETAAVRGTAEVRGAVVASTLTSIAVFFPMVFVEGIAGQAFGDLGLAVVVSLLASLAVAVAFVPMAASLRGLDLAAVAGGGPAPEGSGTRGGPLSRLLRFASVSGFVRDFGGLLRRARWWLWPVAVPYLLARLVLGLVLELVVKLLLVVALLVVFLWSRLLGPVLGGAARRIGPVVDRQLDGLRRAYGRLARRSLARPWTVVAATAAILAVTVWVFAGLDSELLPEVHQGEVTFDLALPVGTPVEETMAVLAPVEEAIRAEVDGIDSLLVTFGFDAANAQRSDEGEHSARFKVLLASSDPAVEERVIRAVRQRLASVPDLLSRVTRPVLFSSKTPIEVEVHGDDLALLKAMGERVAAELAALPELADVETSLRSGAPEVQVVYDRERLQRYGLNLRQTAELVRNQVQGYEATRFNLRDRRIPIVVRLAQEHRETVRDVEELVINPGAERPIPLGAVAAVALGEGPSEVRRIDGQRVAVVAANLASGGPAGLAGASLGSAVAAIEERLSSAIDWPDDMSFYITGQSEEWERSRGSLVLALLLSVFLVYVIMAAQFENLVHPLVILFSIPLAFFGTALLLGALGISLSVVVFLGMIMLAGIVVNNAIVLVDYINVLRRRGLGLVEAVVTAGQVRLRPILMTTATTVLGLSPMA